jgi:hypothetical protein
VTSVFLEFLIALSLDTESFTSVREHPRNLYGKRKRLWIGICVLFSTFAGLWIVTVRTF